jgi:DNA repair exonuclease SbcCD ATPase subunit
MAWGRKREGGGGCVSLLALLLAALALLVAWAAYKRTGGEIGTVLKDAGVQSRGAAGADSDLAEWREDLAQARDRLLGRRAEVAGDRNLEQVRRDVEQVRASLEQAYHKAGAAKEQWKDLDANLQRLEGQLKDGGSKALATLDSAISKLRDATSSKDATNPKKDEGDGRR